MDYIAFASTLIAQNPHSRTLRGDIQGRRVWIKRVSAPKASIWHKVQCMVARLFNMPILRCTVSPCQAESLRMEAQRLRDFKAKGYSVPDILAEDPQMLVLSDAGQSLPRAIEKSDNPRRLLLLAAQALAMLHKQGEVHGRPYIRDLTWDGQAIGFLDLEENPVSVMPLAVAQARDVWVFLISAARFSRKGDNKYEFDKSIIIALYHEYRRHTGSNVEHELKKLISFLSPLRRFLEQSFLWRKIGNDARQAVFISRCLEADFFMKTKHLILCWMTLGVV